MREAANWGWRPATPRCTRLSTAAHRAQPLAGVVELLTALRSAGVAVGLVTGNLEGIAWAKVRAVGLGVTTGVFGADTLWAAGATEVLDGLADTRRVLDVLGV